jgi:hypothetical protein
LEKGLDGWLAEGVRRDEEGLLVEVEGYLISHCCVDVVGAGVLLVAVACA